MTGHLIEPAIKALIDSRNFTALHDLFEEWTPPEIADCIVDFPHEEQAIVFRLLPQTKAADVLEYLDHDAQVTVLKAMGSEAAAKVLNDMSDDDRTRFLEELPPAAVTQTLALLTPDERRHAQALLNYPVGSIGRLMTSHFVAVRDDWTVLQVLEHVRKHGKDSETLNVIYVVDERGQARGRRAHPRSAPADLRDPHQRNPRHSFRRAPRRRSRGRGSAGLPEIRPLRAPRRGLRWPPHRHRHH